MLPMISTSDAPDTDSVATGTAGYTATMTWKPDVTVAAVVERGGEFLMVEERAGGRVVFNQPAGHLEAGETLVEAVVRETLEETAWTFEPDCLLGVYVWTPPQGRRSFLRVAFAGRASGPVAGRRLDRGIVRAGWYSRDHLLARAARLRSPLVMRCLDDYLAGHRHPLEVINHLDSGLPTPLTVTG
jgi:8-oxo-dGTP pyrophosphatase MutT (NUDIX family)